MGMMGELGLGNLGIDSASILGGASTIAKFLFILILGSGLFGLYYYFRINKKLFNKKIHIFENIQTQFIPIDEDTAMEMLIPNTDVKVFYLKKNKIYLPVATRKMGKDNYWYGIRKNREWVNFTLNDLDKSMKEVDLDFDHADMRYPNAYLKKLIERNFKKEKWWQTYRNELGLVMLVLMLGITFFILLGEVKDIVGMLRPLIESSNEVIKASNEVLGKLDSVCSGSGIVRQ